MLMPGKPLIGLLVIWAGLLMMLAALVFFRQPGVSIWRRYSLSSRVLKPTGTALLVLGLLVVIAGIVLSDRLSPFH
jgi:hypothetical protein